MLRLGRVLAIGAIVLAGLVGCNGAPGPVQLEPCAAVQQQGQPQQCRSAAPHYGQHGVKPDPMTPWGPVTVDGQRADTVQCPMNHQPVYWCGA